MPSPPSLCATAYGRVTASPRGEGVRGQICLQTGEREKGQEKRQRYEETLFFKRERGKEENTKEERYEE